MEHVYKKIEVTGSSTVDVTDAIRTAVSKASETIRHLDWFEVDEIRGQIDGGEVSHFQVTMKLGFRLE